MNSGGGVYVGGGGLTLDGTSPPGVTFSGNTAPGGGSAVATSFNVTVQGTNVTLGGDVLINGGGNWTNSPGSAISPTNLVISGGTFNANDSTTNISGNFTFRPTPGNEIAFPGTFNSGTGTFNFTGAGAQSINGPNSPTFNNLVVNKPSGTLTLGVNSPVKSNLTVSSGVLDLGAFTANRTAAGGTLTVSNGATLKIGGTNSLPDQLRDARPRPEQHGRVRGIGRADDHGDELRQPDEQLYGAHAHFRQGRRSVSRAPSPRGPTRTR